MPPLDATFAALADPTRRAILARLATGPATVNELVRPFSMSQPAITKHIHVLEEAGLVTRSREGRHRPVHLAPEGLQEADRYLDGFRALWEARYAQLDQVLAEMNQNKP